MIATMGEALVDLIQHPDGSFRACLGGSIFNFTLGLARQAVPTTYLNPLSFDRFGSHLLTRLIEGGVRLGTGRRSLHPTSLAVIHFDEAGLPKYVFYRGQVADRDVDAVTLIENLPAKLELLHTGSLALAPEDIATTLAVLRAVASSGAVISIDATMRPTAVMQTNEYCTGVMLAMREAHIVKLSDEDLAALSLDTLSLSQLGDVFFTGTRTQLLALTRGALGATLMTRNAQVQMAVPADVRVVDNVGAEECFHAGLVAFLRHAGALASSEHLANLAAHDLGPALAHATTSAGICLARAGCEPPGWEEVNRVKTQLRCYA